MTHPEDSGLDLEGRIALAEQRLVARDLAWQRGVHSVRLSAEEALKPANLMQSAGKALGIGGGAAVAGTALLWWWRSRRPSLATGSRVRTDGADSKGMSASMSSLAGLVGLGWPLMPDGIRNMLSPGAARMVVTFGLPVLTKLFGSRAMPPLSSMTVVDPTRFGGTWTAVAHLPMRLGSACKGLGTVRYAMRRPGEFDLTVRCPAGEDRREGKARSARGVVRLVRGSGGGRFKLSVWPRLWRWLPLAWSDHWVLHLDADYTEALVGSPDRDALWVLSRNGRLAPHRLEYLLTMARDDGFPIEDLQFPEAA